MHLHAVGGDVFHGAHRATMFLAQVHHRSNELLGGDDVGGHHRFDDSFDLAVRELARIGHTMHGAVFGGHLVRHVRGRRDEIETEFAAQPLGDDLHVEQTEEAAAEAESQRHRCLRFVDEGGIVELELVKGLTKLGELGVVDREQPRVDHWLRVTVAGKRLGGGMGCGCDRVAHL